MFIAFISTYEMLMNKVIFNGNVQVNIEVNMPQTLLNITG